MHVTIEELENGDFLLCLRLRPNETSSELRDFASLQPGPNPLPPSLSSTRLPTGLRIVAPRKPQDLDVGVGRPVSRAPRETFIALLDASIARHKAPLGGLIGRRSRGLGNTFGSPLVGRRQGSVSEQIARGTDQSVAEFHTRTILPFLTLPGFSSDFRKAVENDYDILARAGDSEALEDVVELLEGVEERSAGILEAQASPGVVFGDPAVGGPAGRSSSAAGRGILVDQQSRLSKNVGLLKRKAEISLRFAEVIQGRP